MIRSPVNKLIVILKLHVAGSNEWHKHKCKLVYKKTCVNSCDTNASIDARNKKCHFLHYHLCLLLTSMNWDKANVSSDARWNTVISHVVCTCMLLKLRPVCQCTACINQSSREEKISAPFCAYFFFTPTHISGYSRSDITSGSNNGGGDGISTS